VLEGRCSFCGSQFAAHDEERLADAVAGDRAVGFDPQHADAGGLGARRRHGDLVFLALLDGFEFLGEVFVAAVDAEDLDRLLEIHFHGDGFRGGGFADHPFEGFGFDFDEFGDVLVWDEITDLDGEVRFVQSS